MAYQSIITKQLRKSLEKISDAVIDLEKEIESFEELCDEKDKQIEKLENEIAKS